MTLSAEPGPSSVQVLVCVDGGAVVECAGSQPLPLMRGEAVVIPACLPVVTLRSAMERGDSAHAPARADGGGAA